MTTLIRRGIKPTKTGFGEGLLAAGEMNPAIVAIGVDITASVGVNLFAERFPDRFFSLGIAEQNGVAVAAGFALEGKIPVFSTYAVFAALRAADQIRISVCYNDLHVVIGGAHSGVSVGPDGATHQALEDIALMRALPNMTVLSPCDATQAKMATLAACNDIKGPVYIRFGREAVPDFTSEEMVFDPGKAQLLREGKDLAIIATGNLVWEALQAAESLEAQGIHAAVLNIHTLKPIDEEAILKAARSAGRIITAEEHQVHGGLGSAVAEITSRHHPVPIRFIGMNDMFGESGMPSELMKKFGLDSDGIIREALNFVANK
jgi:transketolase